MQLLNDLLMVIKKAKMFIQKIANNTSEEIVWSSRNPITEMENIIEHKHDSSTH